MVWMYLNSSWNSHLSVRMNFEKKPLFMITSDQDWAPSWAIEKLLDCCSGHPVHLFRTNPCPVADNAFKSKVITQGWHPNLLAGSTHGDRPEDVIAYMQENFPGSNTARSHAFNTNTHFDRLLYNAGITVDSQIATLWQDRIKPLLDISRIIRLPVYFEDDVFFNLYGPKLDITEIMKTLMSPGLKIFNIHANFIACNTPSNRHYQEVRDDYFKSSHKESHFIYKGRGTYTVFKELLNFIKKNGFHFQCFQEFADSLLENK